MTAMLEGSLVAPKTTKYELGGPIGAAIGLALLPLVAYALYFVCGPKSCDLTQTASMEIPKNVADWFSYEAFYVAVGFVLLQALLYRIPAGRIGSGSLLRDGSRLSYRLNGLVCLLVSVIVFEVLWYYGQPVTIVYDHFLEMIGALSIVGVVLSLVVYLMSFQSGVLLSESGNSGNVIYDFGMGRALNPRLGRMFDLKTFVFGRIMLIGLVLTDLSMVAKQLETDGKVSLPMALVCVMQICYVFDLFIFEEDMYQSNDFVKQGVGFFVVYASSVFGPLFYTLQARYLVTRPVELSNIQIGAIFILEVVGYIVFRWSNSQKSSYRRNPNSEWSKKLRVLKTARGTNLITSGLWGFVRHPNYLGDLMMALAWCLCTGFDNVTPYAYFAFLLLLLVGRAVEDNKSCEQKYKADWDMYCQIVRYRIIPYIF